MNSPKKNMTNDTYLTLYTICAQYGGESKILPSLININCCNGNLSPEQFVAAFFELCCDNLEEKLKKVLLH